ncbi:carboxypeptidase-like regulatory domain-containing protein [Terriglobus albidus]|uniref:carboxypeptidase-like regulatory domain-containing protein n=1 Tax=Terriglobus albidus TaxID=1592106 RepID=UPI00164D31C1|nr:carboxypeptidase-like regulatory domain-containing protein [Terriglobus albidus]
MKARIASHQRWGWNLAVRSFAIGMLCLLFAGAIGSLHGQVLQRLLGRVSDPSGAVVPEATVTITNEETGVVTTTQTSKTGDWVAPYLSPGRYTVSAARPGFTTAIETGVILNVGQLRSVDLELKIGATTESVTTTAHTLALDTVSADRQAVIEGTAVSDLPFNARNVMVSTIAVPGVGSKNGLNNQLPYGNITSGLVVNSSALSINMDGVNNMSTGFQTMSYLPLVDTVQEMVVDTTPYDAGAVGFATAGNLDVHLKSGTNTLHGTVYEYYKSTGLDANSYQNNYFGRPRASHKSNQYGFELDGPVRIPLVYNGVDRTFFTIAFENFRNLTPNPITTSVPGVFGGASWFTPINGYYQFNGLVQGNGAAITLYDPASPNAAARKSFLSEGAPNSYSIPVSRVNTAALNILKYYPAPNVAAPAGSAPWQNNYYFNGSIPSIYRNFMIKLDHNLSPNDRVSARWGWWNQFQTSNTNGFAANSPAVYGQFPNGQKFQTFFADWVHTFSAHAVFNFKASVNMDEAENKASIPFDTSSLGTPNVSAGVTQQSLLGFFPQVGLSGFAQMGSTATSIAIHNQLSILPSITLVHGPHDIHIGLDNREYQISAKQNAGGFTLTSNQQWTQASNANTADAASGLSIASFMLDHGYLSATASVPTAPNTVTGGLVQPAQEFRSFHYWGVFFQDNYKVKQNLTLNLGLRYDFPTQAVDRHNRYTNTFNSTVVNPISAAAGSVYTGGLTFSGVNGTPRTQIPRAWYLFEPRFGFSYSLNQKTVIKGGIGGTFNWAAYTGSQTGFSATTPLTASPTTLYTTPTSTLDTPFPGGYVSAPGASLGYLAGLGSNISYYSPDTRFGETWNYSLGIQRQLSRGDILDVSYEGKSFTKGPTGDDINVVPASWYAQCNAEIGGNPTLCTAANTANPFKGVNGFQGTNFYTASTVQSGVFKQAFPQYTAVFQNGAQNHNGLWLNSFQVSETHRFAHSLTSTASYAYSRIMDNNGWLDYTYRINARIQDQNDLNHRITFTGVYQLPVGRGQSFLGQANRLVDALLGGWKVGGLFLFETGRPWQPQCGGGQHAGLGGSTGCLETPFGLSPIKMARTVSGSGPQVIRGAAPCVGDRNATTGAIVLRASAISYGCQQANFVYKALYAPVQQITSFGIRLGNTSEFDANLSKSFKMWENYTLIFKVDAFNALNHAVWNNSYQTTNDANFGALLKGPTGQGNQPRQVQLSGTVRW